MPATPRRASILLCALLAALAGAASPNAAELRIRGLAPGAPLSEAIAKGFHNPADERTIGDFIPSEYWHELAGPIELGMGPEELGFKAFSKDEGDRSRARAYFFPVELGSLGDRLSSISDRVTLPPGADEAQALASLVAEHGAPLDAFDVVADFRGRHGKDIPDLRVLKVYLWGARFSRTDYARGFAGDDTRAAKIDLSSGELVLIGIVMIRAQPGASPGETVVLRELVDRSLLQKAVAAARDYRAKRTK